MLCHRVGSRARPRDQAIDLTHQRLDQTRHKCGIRSLPESSPSALFVTWRIQRSMTRLRPESGPHCRYRPTLSPPCHHMSAGDRMHPYTFGPSCSSASSKRTEGGLHYTPLTEHAAESSHCPRQSLVTAQHFLLIPSITTLAQMC
jgi:hypothetical protein